MPDIFINTDRPVDRSIVAGINQPQREAPIGAFVAGSSYDVNLYFVQNDGSYNALSGVGGTDIHVAISTISRPESGTFTLTDGTDTTSAISYGASARVVEDALNALNSDTGLNLGTVSLVDVVKVNDTQYTITFRTFGAMTALSGSTVSLFPESTPTGSIAVTGSSTVYAQQTIELTRQPAIFQETWTTITNGFSGTIALNTTRLLQSLALEPGQPFYLEVKLDAETVAREIVGVEHSTMPASAFSGAAIALKSTEGVDILSTGETGGTKYLREDGDGTSSWQTVAGAAGDMEASTYDPTTVAGDAFDMDNMAEGATTKILTAAERTTIGTVAPHIADTANPHAVTKAQVGLGNVDDTADADKPVSTAQQTAIDAFAPEGTAVLSTGEAGAVKFLREDGDGTSSWQDVSGFAAIESSTSAVDLDFSTDSAGSKTLTGNTTFTFSNIIAGKTVYWHVTGASGYGINWPAEVTWIDSAPANPADGVTESYMFMAESASVVHGWHVQDVDAAVAGVTASTLGLGNVDNTSDTAKPVSTAQQTALDLKQDILAEGAFVDGDKTKLNTLDKINTIADKATAYALTGVAVGTVYKTDDTGQIMEFIGSDETSIYDWKMDGFILVDENTDKLALTSLPDGQQVKVVNEGGRIERYNGGTVATESNWFTIKNTVYLTVQEGQFAGPFVFNGVTVGNFSTVGVGWVPVCEVISVDVAAMWAVNEINGDTSFQSENNITGTSHVFTVGTDVTLADCFPSGALVKIIN